MNRKNTFRWFVLSLFAGFLFSGCTGQKPTTPDIEIPESVTIVSPDEFYPYRAGFSLIVFQNKLWFFGGGGNSSDQDVLEQTSLYDIWNSADGIHWVKVADQIFEDDRVGYQIVGFKNKLWAIGGVRLESIIDNLPRYQYFNEIWSSEDGVVWNKVTDNPGYGPRRNMAVVATKEAMWMFGGIPENGFRQLPEVWRSRNGSAWELVTDELPLTRVRTGKFVFDDNLFLFVNSHPELWQSNNGQIWTPVNISESTFNEVFNFKEGLRSRAGYASTIHNGQLYVLGGWNYPTNTERYSNLLNDVWRSPNGETWERVSEREEETDKYMDNFDTFPARSGHSVVSFRGMLYLTGGQGEGKLVGLNTWEPTNFRDAWVSPDGKTWYELARVQE